MRFLYSLVLMVASLGFLGVIGGIALAVYLVSYFAQDLPDYNQLKNYTPSVLTRLYAGDGRLLQEYAEERRVFVPIESVPESLRGAFISAEDQNFWEHQGVDPVAILRAAIRNAQAFGTGRRPEGASTITQQVAKNFLLGNEVSYRRKIREAILAYRMERALSKEQLLELYLNEIYLGGGTYGVAAAALHYFDKRLEDLSLEEAAYLAALPKAPNNYHPVRSHDKAVARRNWVLDRMAEDGVITLAQADLAKRKPLVSVQKTETDFVRADYFAEEVRRDLRARYGGQGPESLYGGGLAVRTTVDPRLQDIAVRALRAGLVAYDRRWGYRGALDRLESLEDWRMAARARPRPGMLPSGWARAVVLETTQDKAVIGFPDGQADPDRGEIHLDEVKWARAAPRVTGGVGVGPEITSVLQVLKAGDIIAVRPLGEEKPDRYDLMQIPEIQGAILAMDPHTGRVLAMQGGWTYDGSEFNRATQAWRQPGSAFKPFVYLAALEQGFTPATLVLDAPFVMEQRPGVTWSPRNYSGEYYGPTPIRVGVEKSRNLMTVRLADYIGMDTVIAQAEKFGVVRNLQPFLSHSLGAGETTLLRLTTGYAQLVNGGKTIIPTFIDRIQDRRGKTIFRHDSRPCVGCGSLVAWTEGQAVPAVPDTRLQITDPRHAYQMVSILEGVVQRGTATRIRSLNRPLAGKTGTTNESRDAWFIGFSPDLAVGVFVGFDGPRSMGRRETGSSVAVPIFRDFMAEALDGTPPTPFRIPAGIRQVRINAETGARASAGDETVIWESFLVGTEPTDDVVILDGGGLSRTPLGTITESESPITGTGGLY